MPTAYESHKNLIKTLGFVPERENRGVQLASLRDEEWYVCGTSRLVVNHSNECVEFYKFSPSPKPAVRTAQEHGVMEYGLRFSNVPAAVAEIAIKTALG
jgi:hypothetical protein